MSDEAEIRRSLMHALGGQALAVSLIDNGRGEDPWALLARVRTALVDGVSGQPLIHLQVCPLGIHRDWWTDGVDEPCPWCRIAELEGAPALPEAS
jgi:hypothetical protein